MKFAKRIFASTALLSPAACGGGGGDGASAGGVGSGNNSGSATWGPSQPTIIFLRNAGGAQHDLYAVKDDGSGLVTLADSADDELFVGITPGGRVVFQVAVGGGQNDLLSVNLDGTGLVGLGRPGRWFSAASMRSPPRRSRTSTASMSTARICGRLPTVPTPKNFSQFTSGASNRARTGR